MVSSLNAKPTQPYSMRGSGHRAPRGPRAGLAERVPHARNPPAAGRPPGAINELGNICVSTPSICTRSEDQNIEGAGPDANRLELDLLQAIRLALIMRIFILLRVAAVRASDGCRTASRIWR
jgi:hypothetical protein